MMSLRSRFITGVIGVTAVLLCMAGVTIYSATKLTLLSNFDKSLQNTARILSAIVESEGTSDANDLSAQTGEKAEFDVNESALPEFSHPGAYYEFRDQRGNSIIKSPSLKDVRLGGFEEIGKTEQYYEIILPDGQTGRAIGFQFSPKTDSGKPKTIFSIVIARDTSSIMCHLEFLKRLMLGTGISVIFLSIFAGLVVTKHGLKPIHFLANEISGIDIKNPYKSNISKNYPIELSPVINCLNSLFARLKASFEKEKQFNSDVAHELRTPLAGIKSTIEVCLSRNNRSCEEYKTSLATCLNVTNSMHRMVDSLLSLARFESQQQPLHYEDIVLSDLIEECWIRFADRAHDRKINFKNNIEENLVYLSDKIFLSMVFSNILDNAVEHSDLQGRIRVEEQTAQDRIMISISNTGCKINQQDIDKIFNSFWKADGSRQNTGRHCGIGLTVVKRIVEILGGTAAAQVTPDQIFTITITLPVKK